MKDVRNLTQPGEPVFIELILNQKGLSRPYLAIHKENYCEQDAVRTKFTILYPNMKKGNHYFFELLNQQYLWYFSIVVTKKRNPLYLLKNYLMEPGDHIRIATPATAGSDAFDFSGRGAEKYRCQGECQHILCLNSIQREPLYSKTGVYNNSNSYLQQRKQLLQVIDKFGTALSYDSFALLKADVIYQTGRAMTEDFLKRMVAAVKNNDLHLYRSFIRDYPKKLQQKKELSIPDKINYLSKEYAQYAVIRQVCNYFSQYMRLNFIGIYHEITKIKNTDLRDKVTVALFIIHHTDMQADYHSLLDHAINAMNNKECLEKLSYFASLY